MKEIMKKITKPSVKQVEKYLRKWEKDPKYPVQDRIVVPLFKHYPHNTKIEEVLHKVTILNFFYSTQIRDTFTVAQHIVRLKIDKQLRKGEEDIVEEIAKVSIGGKERRFYSFATKYCSHHQPDVYPIYDSFVREGLAYFNEQDIFADFTKKAIWEDYTTFKQVILAFQKEYKLDSCSLRDIDRYLWLLGREKFPKIYNNIF
jgi:hypothetical protein